MRGVGPLTLVRMNDTITVVGNIATQPESITTSTGKTLTRLRLASSSRRYNTSQNQWEEGHTNWYTVRVWGRLGEHLNSSVGKGEQIIVQGRLKIETNQGDNGQTYTNITIDADNVGPSLTFGTTSFQRAVGGGQSSGESTASSQSQQGDHAIQTGAEAQTEFAEAAPAPF